MPKVYKTQWKGFTIVLALAFTVLLGCSNDTLESTVSGRITLDGKPIGPGAVVFAPVEGTSNPGIGAVETDGSYSVRTAHTAGIRPGKYRVSVTVRELPPEELRGRRDIERPLLHPAKYVSTETSGLEYEIKPGSNTINVELKSE